MTEKIIARQIEGGMWQWRQVADHGGWASEYYSTGDADAIAASRSSSSVPVVVGIGGQHVAGRDVEIEIKDKRHVGKLLPYEMEDYLIDSVDDLHFVHAIVEGKGDDVTVLYLKQGVMEQALQQMNDVSCDAPVCVPDYLFLIRENDGATIIYEDNKVTAHLEEGKGFSIEAELAQAVLADIEAEFDETKVINLVADSREKLEKLALWTPVKWREEGGPEIKVNEGGFWDWADPTFFVTKFNLRRGRFSRQLPFDKWVKVWRFVGITVAAAFLLSVLVAFGEYIIAKNENKQIREQITKIYQEAVPGGRSRDPEGDLSSKVRTLGKKSEPSNFMALFGSVAASMKDVKDIKITAIRYNSDQRELQLNMEANDFSVLEGVRVKVEASGLAAEFLRVDKKSGTQNAKMKVTEVN